MARVIDKDELPYGGIAHKFEGGRYGGVSVSFFLVDAPPGSGGQIVVVPAGISTTDPATSVSSRARRDPTHYADRLGAA